MNVAIPMVDIPQQRTRQLGSLKSEKAALPLASVSLRARVADRIAQVTVEQKFHNPLSEVVEAVYVFPLAGGCAVSSFEMQIGARTLQAKIEERGEARRQYAEALDAGKRAALLEQERDDVFTVQAGNIAPGDEITVRLTYSERLPFFENGRTELRLPLVVAPRYVGGDELPREQAGLGVASDTTTVPDASRISPPRLAPGFDPRVALSIDAELFGKEFAELECSQHAVRTSTGPEGVKVQLSKEREPLDRDFVLRWKLAGARVQSQLLVHGEFALLSVIPPAREGFLGAPRDVVFVVDRSGSMEGVKMASAARACALLLRTLSPRDRFAVQAFDDHVEWMPGGFIEADEGGIDRGEKWLREIFARGGTELDGAMGAAFLKIREAPASEGRASVVVLLTDGQVGDESSVLRRLQAGLGDARVFTVGIDTAVNGGFLKRLAALGGGTSTLVEPGARLDEALQAVGREIGAPLVTGLRVEGEVSDGAPASLPDLFAGRASAAFFRFGGGRVKVTGRASDGSRFEEVVEPREAPLAAIDHLWARARVMDLEDEFRASHAPEVKKKIIALSIKHAVLTRFTAFVVADDQVVNEGGRRRTVVQPVEMPAEWAPQTQTMAMGPMRAMSAPAAGGRSPRAAMPAMAKMQGSLKGLTSVMQNILQKHGAIMGVADDAGDERATPGEREKVRKALEAFVHAFAQAKSAGAGATAQALEDARMQLMNALSQALAIAIAVPLLQAFLRSAAVEIIAALKAGAAPAFDRHAAALQAALDEARDPLDAPSGKAAAGSFWEASI